MTIGSIFGSRLGSVLGSLFNVGSDFPGAFPGSLVGAMVGDSDTVGFATAIATDTGFTPTALIPAIQYNDQWANSTNLPIAYNNYPSFGTLGPLGPYDNPNNQSLGQEISLGQELLRLTSAPVILKKGITGSTLASNWLPTSTYPAAGSGNLFNTTVAEIHNFETQVGRTLDFIVVNLGTNDGVLLADANAFNANMTAFAAALRVVWPGLKIVWVKCNVNVPNANIGTVITAQVAVDAADANMALVNYDDCPLTGSFHCTGEGYLTMGQRSAFRALDLLGVARRNITTTPDVVAYGPIAFGTGNLTLLPGADERDGDLEIADVCVGFVAGAITTPAGWTLVADSGNAVASGVTVHRSVYVRPVTNAGLATGPGGQTMPATVFTITTANRNAGQIFTVRGPNLNPTVDVSQPFANNAFGTSPVSITGVTTTAANTLVMCFSGGACGSDGSMVVTNGGLTNVREIKDSVANILTDREICNLTVGAKASAGATGSFSATCSANTLIPAVTVAIKP